MGGGVSGQFINYVFKRNNKIIDYVVDKKHSMYTYRPYILRTLNPKFTRVIITFSIDKETADFLESYGYNKGCEYEEITTWFCKYGHKILGFENWIEYNYDLDITSIPAMGNKKINDESHSFHWGLHDYKFMEVFDSFSIKDDDAVFDYGCGKGGVLLLLKLRGFNIVGGVEYDDYLHSVAIENFNKIGLESSRIINGDATSIICEIDEYNYFFFYDPFVGKQFEKVVDNIIGSLKRNKRKIIIIYASPQCDSILQRKKIFLTKKIEANCLEYPGINIYALE